MKKSSIFYENGHRQTIERKIKSLLNEQKDFLSARTVNSPRAVGDAVENIIVENFKGILGNLSGEYSSTFARRAMADMAFTDKNGYYYVVDVKTHRLDTKFNMPNLTSVERLTRFYEEDSNYFCILKIDYGITDTKAGIKRVTFVPIEFLNWECLTIGALGWGQIQIANANFVKITASNSRKQWMLQLCDTMLEFYPREMGKINDRIAYFRRVKKIWEDKGE